MTELFSEDEVVTTVTRLTRRQLVTFIEDGAVKPQRATGGYVFGRIDIARLELLCDLTEDLELDNEALGVVVSLIDQLHAARQEIAVLVRAIDLLPPETQATLMSDLKRP